ncbi:MAG: hypothetical protein D6785_13820 [Planctomycetota bacterium]|nr:MAG: hypothetical protein D6785_13820 [Planctomycetota bacterium]
MGMGCEQKSPSTASQKEKPRLSSTKELISQLEKILLHQAAIEKDPTIQLHLIAALGPKKESQVLAQDFLAKYLKKKKEGNREILFFPKTLDSLPVEPHSNQFLKVCLDAGFLTQWLNKNPTILSLLESAKWRFPQKPLKEAMDLGWSLYLFSALHLQKWKNMEGEQVTLKELFQIALEWLEDLYDPIQKSEAKKKFFPVSPIHHWFCGGFHLLQGVLAAQKAVKIRTNEELKIQKILKLTLYRLEKEPGLYWAVIEKKKSKNKKLSLYLNLLKFYGHFFEVLGWAKDQGIWSPTSKDWKRLEKGFQVFQKILKWFIEKGIYKDSSHLAKRWGQQFYRDLWNDTCHSLRGLRAWKKELKK